MTPGSSGCAAHRVLARSVLLWAFLWTGGCASAGHLAEYDFRGRPLGVVALNTPRPELLTNDVLDVDLSNPFQAAVRVGADLMKELEAARARPRLDEAAVVADVRGRMMGRVLEGMAGELRAVPVAEPADAEFEIDVVIKRYGIDADGWHSAAHFFVESEVVLRDAASGRRIWKGKVTEREAITPRLLGLAGGPAANGPANDIVTAAALTSLSTEAMVQTLEALADFTSDRMLARFRKGLEKARG